MKKIVFCACVFVSVMVKGKKNSTFEMPVRLRGSLTDQKTFLVSSIWAQAVESDRT